MNETLKTLMTRRSCKKFKPDQIKDEELDYILKAGTNAPTGRGLQSPIIIVIQDKDTIKKIAKLNSKIMGAKDVDPFYGAPTLIVVLADKNIGTYVEDGSLVLGNLMNAAFSLNVGSCWIHRAKEEFQTKEGKELLKCWGVSDNYIGIGHCVLGYPAEEYKIPAPRKKDYIRFIK